jgi:hypothetical protein
MAKKNIKSNSNDVLNYLVDHYEQLGTLPTPVIECTLTGTAYTCFGSNLKNKVEKAGGIRELLTTFVGRGAKKKAEKAPKAQQAVELVKAKIEKRTGKKLPEGVEIITPATA